MRLKGKPVVSGGRYRVALNNYLASGGDSLTAFTRGIEVTDKGIVDLDALIAWIAPGRAPPKTGRVSFVP